MNTISKVFWMYGRSGAGKTTLARRLREGFIIRQIPVFYLDGDELRSSLCSDLGYTSDARVENHRRVAEVAKLAANQGYNVVVATMAPQYNQRDVVSSVLGTKLVWLYIHAPLDVCIQRDPKGLYTRAKTDTNINIIDFPFDEPRQIERENYIDTANSEEKCYHSILDIAQSHIADFSI